MTTNVFKFLQLQNLAEIFLNVKNAKHKPDSIFLQPKEPLSSENSDSSVFNHLRDLSPNVINHLR